MKNIESIRLLKKYFIQALAFGSIMTFLEFGQNGTELLNYFIYITTAYFVLGIIFEKIYEKIKKK